MASIPDRGAFIVLDFTPKAGHEQAGRRIAIVLSPKDFNDRTGFIVVCPITNQKKGYPFEVEIPADGISPDGPGDPITGVVLTDQVKSLDWRARNIKVLKHYDQNDPQIKAIDEIIEECLAKIATFLT
ncbi:MAG TPA: type II toxin-antitoxin system PemK/MazF family toxin [Thermoclostridium sp.]|nr:toxin MazF [Clostridiaceae bacterium]HOQ76078.1 type II toxin-antitoxin system PemK/MazF family toxin [Thermoclostridium sp.]